MQFPGDMHTEFPVSDLKPIRDKAKEIHERVTVEGRIEDEGVIAAVSGLAEDIRDILLEYLVST